MSRNNGSLFGTLCAIHPAPQPAAIERELPLIELLAKLLGGLLDSELKATERLRISERLEVESRCDALTGLYNRRAWDRLLEAEEQRCRRYGHAACVVFIDLDGLKAMNDTRGHSQGDELIRRAGQIIKAAMRDGDVVSRIGGDEFAVLGVECGPHARRVLCQRIRGALDASGIAASLGNAMRIPSLGLLQAWQEADQAMYADKEGRRVQQGQRARKLERSA